MLFMLYLISANVYNSLEAPPGRGFSYTEIWMVGIQIPILVALIEYSVILGFQKFGKIDEIDSKIFVKRDSREKVTENELKNSFFIKIDKICLIMSILYLITFCAFYWIFLP